MENSKFPAFPYEPYSIQVDFMNALYRSLENGGVSMLESPTGTGKTLSIICSALQWVLDHKKQEKWGAKSEASEHHEIHGQTVLEDEPDWMRDFVVSKDSLAEEKKMKKKKLIFGSKKHRQQKNHEDSVVLVLGGSEKVNFHEKKESESFQKTNDTVELTDEEFLLEEYDSEEDDTVGSVKLKRKANGICNSSSSDEEEEEAPGEEKERLKIYFCSRTHSQLSQFVKELRKTDFADEIMTISLGSRKNFCINKDVLRLGNSTRINERCLELQKNTKNGSSKIKNLGVDGSIRRTKSSKASSICGCPMLRKNKLNRQFKDKVAQEGVMDIEDLVQLGRGLGTCPYYGSRSMVPAADLVVLPYQSLLSKSSRESLGLNLKNNIVIIDEAHNLADSLISMYDAKLTMSQLENVHDHIKKYFGRFQNLLGSGNRRYIQTLMVLTRAFLRVLFAENNTIDVNTSQDEEKAFKVKPAFCSSMAINEFLFSLNIDNINLVKLLEYIKQSNIIHKVSGYGEKAAASQNLSLENSGKSGDTGSTLSGFRAFVDILVSLKNNNGDGRIIISRMRSTASGHEEGYLKFVMLTGEKLFSEIVNEAHAVILAGGTLQPIEETRERLFPWLPSNELQFFSCSHIIPPESILPIAVSRGPSGQSMDFSYSSRSLTTMIQELGLLICNLVTLVPEGIVVFFSSFEYESQVHDAWKTSGILERIMKKKRVFREPRQSNEVEFVLKEYKDTIDRLSSPTKQESPLHNGAILLAVIGGKISEGINFSDGMGRCIVVVGLPYPSPSDIELLERIKHIENLGDSKSTTTSNVSASDEYYDGDIQAGFNILRSCRRRGKEYYENLCMKAVNQSIGRAIRHVNDYAAILLVDKRYSHDSSKTSFSHPTNKLPQWIKDRLVSTTNNYGEVHKLLHQFFRLNKNRGLV